jgi:hypothetical protein
MFCLQLVVDTRALAEEPGLNAAEARRDVDDKMALVYTLVCFNSGVSTFL